MTPAGRTSREVQGLLVSSRLSVRYAVEYDISIGGGAVEYNIDIGGGGTVEYNTDIGGVEENKFFKIQFLNFSLRSTDCEYGPAIVLDEAILEEVCSSKFLGNYLDQ
ncbi:hypothetical protein J6590_103874, partial [Homalodisca vitripennis]